MKTVLSRLKKILKPAETESDDDEDQHHAARNNANESDNVEQANIPRTLRRSRRVRGRPDRFGQSVYD